MNQLSFIVCFDCKFLVVEINRPTALGAVRTKCKIPGGIGPIGQSGPVAAAMLASGLRFSSTAVGIHDPRLTKFDSRNWNSSSNAHGFGGHKGIGGHKAGPRMTTPVEPQAAR
jgi:hypothetical protein